MRALTTERLTLEPLALVHAPLLLAYEDRNREHLRRWEPTREPKHYTLAGQEAIVARDVGETAQGNCARWVVFERFSEEICAVVNLWGIRRGIRHVAILGYSVDARRGGHGIATEAAAAVVRYAFDELKIHRLETFYQPENVPSGRVLRKLGFTVEGYARDYILIGGSWRDAVLVGLVNSRST